MLAACALSTLPGCSEPPAGADVRVTGSSGTASADAASDQPSGGTGGGTSEPGTTGPSAESGGVVDLGIGEPTRVLEPLVVDEQGRSPERTVSVTSPGVYRAVVHEATGGGISEFYDLASDPGATKNVAWPNRGLFEIGWHGSCPDGSCQGTTRDWPSDAGWRLALGAAGQVDVIEQSDARVRIRVTTIFTHWGNVADSEHPLSVVYTFYPSGQIYAQVRVQRTAGLFRWSREYGPHIAVSAAPDDPLLNSQFAWSTPTVADLVDGTVPADALVLAASPLVPTRLFVTIPSHEQRLFTLNMRHDGRSVNWDRAGFGSANIEMGAGYDDTWSCLVQFGSSLAVLPQLHTAADALPYATQYRAPPILTGARTVATDPGDSDGDGFNEAEGVLVLTGPGPVAFDYDCGQSACFAPAFKVVDWVGPAPSKVVADDGAHAAISAVIDGTLILQVEGPLPSAGRLAF